MIAYRRRPSALHAARAAAGCAYCGALALAAMLANHPLVIAGAGAAALAAGAAAGVGRELRGALRAGVPLVVLAAAINALVSRHGITVIARLGEAPVIGRVDVTLEAAVEGAILGLRVAALLLCAALYTAAVDPDEVLRLFRRLSFRSALTASLATRLAPVLARDGRRMADAQRCRPGPPAPRLALVRAVAAGALERAVDVAAALEVRGYGGARRPPRRPRPWSRHDVAVALAAAAVAALAVAGRVLGLAGFGVDPTLRAGSVAGPAALALATVALALLPFARRRGIA